MVIAIIGENCAGKSTLAESLRERVGAEIITGKDYLRMAKSESEATALFTRKLEQAMSDGNIIYVISEKEHLSLLPQDAVRILVTAPLETIKERFRARMRGTLPPPVEQMLERKHGMFDNDEYALRFENGKDEPELICESIVKLLR